jgi:hypothetical protein
LTSVGNTVLGTGDPRDAGVQYGINIAVLDNANDGSWGKIAFWNGKSLGSVSMSATQPKSAGAKSIAYQLTIKNLGPASQPFAISDPIPDKTKYQGGVSYVAATNSVEWKGTLAPYETKSITFSVVLKPGTPAGTKITNKATLVDDGNGGSAAQTITVK